jgi:hypothetical protein
LGWPTTSRAHRNRLWNLAGDILGEMPLPNLTDQMKDMRNRLVQIKVWKFLLDRIVVCEAHEELARQLLQEMAEAGLLVRSIAIAVTVFGAKH